MGLSRGHTGIVLAVLVVLGGCTTWRRDPDALKSPIPQRQPVQIWSDSRALVAHGVEIQGDSIRAVPRWKPPACDTCARFFAISAIDSVRVRHPSPIRTGVLAVVLAAWAYITIGLAGYGGPSS
jgi:hypothetical protein